MPWWLAGMPPKTDKSKRQMCRSALYLHFAACLYIRQLSICNIITCNLFHSDSVSTVFEYSMRCFPSCQSQLAILWMAVSVIFSSTASGPSSFAQVIAVYALPRHSLPISNLFKSFLFIKCFTGCHYYCVYSCKSTRCTKPLQNNFFLCNSTCLIVMTFQCN